MEPDQTKQDEKRSFSFNRAKVIVPLVVAFAAVITFVIIMANTDQPGPAASAPKFATADEFATAWNQAAGWPDDDPLMHKLSLQLSSGCLAQKIGATPQKIIASADDLWQGMTRRGSMTRDQFVELLTASTELPC